jgi:hypothetical protein
MATSTAAIGAIAAGVLTATSTAAIGAIAAGVLTATSTAAIGAIAAGVLIGSNPFKVLERPPSGPFSYLSF